MPSKIIFVHNLAIHYRLPLFAALREHFGSKIDFWFYHEPIKERKHKFSFHYLWRLFKEKEGGVFVLTGSRAYELPLVFLLLKLKKKKIVFWTETWRWGTMNFKNRLFVWLVGEVARHSDLVLYPGQQVRKFFLDLGINEKKMIFAPNAGGADLKKFWRSPVNSRGRRTVVFLGRLLPQKGVHILIEAFRKLDKDRYLLLIGGKGDAGYENRLRSLAAGCHNVYFCGEIIKDRVGSFLNQADVVVYPSANINGVCEAWGMVLAEAVSLGKPVVATTAVAAAYDLINEGENGFLIEQNDADMLAEAIEKAVILNKFLVVKASQEKRLIYSYDKMAAGFIEAINNV